MPRKPHNPAHENLLPLVVQPLPPLIPHNPLSLLQILYTYLFCRKSCIPRPHYSAKFNLETLSVDAADARTMKDLWEHGFFGKGSLSRSEPTWLSRNLRARGLIGPDEALTAEELTERRRRERKEFKAERARAEKEKIEKQLLQEGKIGTLSVADSVLPSASEESGPSSIDPPPPEPGDSGAKINISLEDVENLEHLQLTFEEAFFLVYGLGVLDVEGPSKQITSPKELFQLILKHSSIPTDTQLCVQPNHPFILNYVVYHHFRSLGWVVRPGAKFGVDYLLYNRGPVFSHAEFGVCIIPSYSDPLWESSLDLHKSERKSWQWLHCVTRVSSQVKKTVLLVYVDVPPRIVTGTEELAELFKSYKVREFSLRRWIVARNRD